MNATEAAAAASGSAGSSADASHSGVDDRVALAVREHRDGPGRVVADPRQGEQLRHGVRDCTAVPLDDRRRGGVQA